MESDARSTRVLSGGGNASSGAEDPYSSSSTFTGKRKAEMTAEERASYERERNRVHARNTRARKKQYMEELKERVENMHAQKVMEPVGCLRGVGGDGGSDAYDGGRLYCLCMYRLARNVPCMMDSSTAI